MEENIAWDISDKGLICKYINNSKLNRATEEKQKNFNEHFIKEDACLKGKYMRRWST